MDPLKAGGLDANDGAMQMGMDGAGPSSQSLGLVRSGQEQGVDKSMCSFSLSGHV